MEAFRTEIQIPRFPFNIGHSNRVLIIGSCFSEHIGTRLTEHKIPTLINPFGILFNPFSIANAAIRIFQNRTYAAGELTREDARFVSLDHHGSFFETSEEALLERVNTSLMRSSKWLENTDVLILTLGTAWAYRHLSSNRLVGNCHKIPNKAFSKELMSVQEVHLCLRNVVEYFHRLRPSANVLFTVSPVRHWKDGPIQNQRSKAILHSALHMVVDEFESAHYFPSYELIMDDLRDYRFYSTDMLHPNEQAVGYVWEKFKGAFFDLGTITICEAIAPLMQTLKHRPIDPESNSFQRFTRKQLDTIQELSAKYPTLDFSKERAHFEAFVLD